jgi:GNAT superfamily N-acetyltransferase
VDLRIQTTCEGIDWNNVSEVLKTVEMAYFDGAVHKKAFENSYTVVFIFDAERLVGFGRAISDGEYEAAVYDVAVLPEYQGKGIGRLIISNIVKNTPHCNIILFASPGKEEFYQKQSFRKMKTGMALFSDPEKMKEAGFTE